MKPRSASTMFCPNQSMCLLLLIFASTWANNDLKENSRKTDSQDQSASAMDIKVLPYTLQSPNNRDLKNSQRRYTLLTSTASDSEADVSAGTAANKALDIDQAADVLPPSKGKTAVWDRVANFALSPPPGLGYSGYGGIEPWRYFNGGAGLPLNGVGPGAAGPGGLDNCFGASTALPTTLFLMLNLGLLSYVLFGILGSLNRLFVFGPPAGAHHKHDETAGHHHQHNLARPAHAYGYFRNNDPDELYDRN